MMSGKKISGVFLILMFSFGFCFAGSIGFSIVWPYEVKDNTKFTILDNSEQIVVSGSTISINEEDAYQDAFAIKVDTNSKKNLKITYKATNFIGEDGVHTLTLKFSYGGSDVLIATKAAAGSTACEPTSATKETTIVTGVTMSNPSTSKQIKASVLLGSDFEMAKPGDYLCTVTIIQVTE